MERSLFSVLYFVIPDAAHSAAIRNLDPIDRLQKRWDSGFALARAPE
jgi:hypothetical protein